VFHPHRRSLRREPKLATLSGLAALCLLTIPQPGAAQASGGAPASAAAPYDSSLFSGMRWRLLGPFRAGRSVAATGVPGEPSHFYFGAAGGGVWETHDAGTMWRPIFDGQPIASVGAVAVAPSNPKVVYVGTGEADVRSDMSYGNGVYRSDDGGRTWRHEGLEDTRRIGRIVVDPNDPDRAWVAALGHAYGPNAERGVFRTTDGGRSWKKVLYRDENTGAIDLALDPSDPNTLYAALWATRRPPWNVYPPSNGYGGVYESTDGGDSWKLLEGGLPHGVGVGRIGIAVAPSDPQRLYAQVDAKQGGIYRSDDGGASWTKVNDEARVWGRGWYFGSVTVDPQNEDVVYAMNTSVYRSTDGGRTFAAWKGAPGGDDYHQLWIDPAEPLRMVLASDQGVVVTLDGGMTWSTWNNQPTGQFYHVTTDDRFPYSVYGSQQDSGARLVLSRSFGFGGLDFHEWQSACAGGESGYIAVDRRDPDFLYGTSYDGSVTRCRQATGIRQDISPQLAWPDTSFRAVWTMPVVASEADSTAIFFANQHVFETRDRGASWRVISPDLTRDKPPIPANLDSATAQDLTGIERASSHWGVVYTIAPSPVRAAEIWAGTDDGLIWVTRDDGATWANVTPPGITAWSKVTMIEASHSDPLTAWATLDRHRLDDLAPHLYRTRDGGKTWTETVLGIPDGAFLRAVREDPGRPGLLFAGTELGPYVSFDAGDHWQSLGLGMPVAPVRDFAVRQRDLVAATHGRAFWVLDDLSPLRQLTPAVAAAPVWLFRPDTAIEIRSRSRGAPSDAVVPDIDPVELAAGENPPSGAILDYHLAAAAHDSVTLEVLDSAGARVRRWSSTEKPRAQNPSTMKVPAGWAQAPETLPADAGEHRFTWDLRYASPGGGAGGGFFGSGGPWALPGRYTVRLTVDGTAHTQPLVVRLDPRLHVPQATLVAQLAFARRVAAASRRVATAERAVVRLRERLDSIAAPGTGRTEKAAPGLSAQAARVGGEAHRILGEAPPSNPDNAGVGDGPPAPGSLLFLRGVLSRLQSSAESGVSAPTAEARAGFEKASAALETTLAAWDRLQRTDVQALNKRLVAAGLPPLPGR
jgi:photosystem II stability/assembly factor-like uncharacterized protein